MACRRAAWADRPQRGGDAAQSHGARAGGRPARRRQGARLGGPGFLVSASTGPAQETVALAVTLLRRIAEDPLLRGSHREAARRHLRKLYPPERLVAAVGDDAGDAA